MIIAIAITLMGTAWIAGMLKSNKDYKRLQKQARGEW